MSINQEAVSSQDNLSSLAKALKEARDLKRQQESETNLKVLAKALKEARDNKRMASPNSASAAAKTENLLA